MAQELTKASAEPTDLTARLRASLSSMPLALSSDWTPALPLPAEYRARIPEALRLADASTRPASAQEFAVCMAELLEWVETFGVVPLPEDKQARRNRLSQIAASYRKALEDVPPDLLQDAVRQVAADASFRVLPLPGDLRKKIADELERRRHAARRLSTAQRLARFEEPEPPRQPPTPEERAEVEARVAELMASLKGMAPEHRIADWTAGNPLERAPKPEAMLYREARQAVAAHPRARIPLPGERQAGEAAE